MIYLYVIWERYKKRLIRTFSGKKMLGVRFVSALRETLSEKSLKGSYTLEAALLMSVVLLVVSSLIITSYRWRNQTVGSLKLQEMIEVLRHTEENELPEGKKLDVTAPTFQLTAQCLGNLVIAKGKGEGWDLEIENKKFDPEEFLRMISLIVE